MGRFFMVLICGSRLAPGLAVVVILLAVACGASATSAPTAVPATIAAATPVPTIASETTPTLAPTAAATPSPTSVPSSTARATEFPAPTKTQAPSPTVAPTFAQPQATSTPEPTSTVAPRPTDVPATQEPETGEGSNSVDLSPSKDNTLYETSANIASNGSGQHLFAGNTGTGSARRAFLSFDVASAIPAGATVTVVALTLNMPETQASLQEIGLHRLLSDWGEGESDARSNEGVGIAAVTGDATWVHTFFESGEWENQGGDFLTTASSTQEIGGTGHYTWSSTEEMVADVQSWLDDPAANFGWLLLGNESSTQTSKRFDSRENATG
ncbi:MAG TPA: DNRLRE domain-containing protein [Dehalococcoidia bacterium]|nr:DNRLRE domain-containing protein [Dehalococcoidia bacterium]